MKWDLNNESFTDKGPRGQTSVVEKVGPQQLKFHIGKSGRTRRENDKTSYRFTWDWAERREGGLDFRENSLSGILAGKSKKDYSEHMPVLGFVVSPSASSMISTSAVSSSASPVCDSSAVSSSASLACFLQR